MEGGVAKRKLKIIGVTETDEGTTFWAVDGKGFVWFKGIGFGNELDKDWVMFSDESESLYPLVGEVDE